MVRNFISAALALTFVFVLFMEHAHAYIDPGTGSMILQALLAGAVAALAFGKQIYRYVYGLFHKGEKETEDKKPEIEDDA